MSLRRGYGSPYPYDAVISGQPVMLTRDAQGESSWIEKKIQYFQEDVAISAEDRGYQQFPAEVELPYVVSDFSDGAGLSEQTSGSRHAYYYAIDADASSGHVICGPKFNAQQTLTLSASPSHHQFIEFNSILYLVSGEKIFKRADDTGTGWTAVTVPAGFAGQQIGQCVVFRGTQSAPFLFIPLGSGVNYYVMSTAEAFTQHASQKAQNFEVINDELWLANTESNQRVIKKATDGGTAATWGGSTTIGDSATDITWLRATAGRLFALKTDSVYGPSLDSGSTVDVDLMPNMRHLTLAANGKGAIAWNEALVFPFGEGVWKYDPDSGSLEQFGPETLEHNASEVKGPVKALAAHSGLAIYAAMYNSANGHSYLAKYGGWHYEHDGRTQVTRRTFSPVWHFALKKWASLQVVAMGITSLVSSLPRLYVLFSSGAVQWCQLARTGNPKDDPNYRFNTSTGELYLPRYNAGFPFETKMLKAFGVGGRDLSAGAQTIGVQYRAVPDTSYTAVGTTSSSPGERLEVASPPSAAAFDFKLTVATTADTASPCFARLVTYAALRTAGLKEITATIDAHDRVMDREGRLLRFSAEEFMNNIESSMTSNGTISVITPKGETITAIGLDFANMLMRTDDQGGRRWAIRVRLIQTRLVYTRGTWARAGAYTWGQLAPFTWAEVASI